MGRRRTLQERIETRIARKRGEDVFLPREFTDLGGEDQVLRALRRLVREGRFGASWLRHLRPRDNLNALGRAGPL